MTNNGLFKDLRIKQFCFFGTFFKFKITFVYILVTTNVIFPEKLRYNGLVVIFKFNSSVTNLTVRPNPDDRETWGFPVVRLGSTRLPVMVYKSVLSKGYPKGGVK